MATSEARAQTRPRAPGCRLSGHPGSEARLLSQNGCFELLPCAEESAIYGNAPICPMVQLPLQRRDINGQSASQRPWRSGSTGQRGQHGLYSTDRGHPYIRAPHDCRTNMAVTSLRLSCTRTLGPRTKGPLLPPPQSSPWSRLPAARHSTALAAFVVSPQARTCVLCTRPLDEPLQPGA